MRVYVQVKQLGKRKCNIEKIPVDFPVPPVDVQGLIEAIVSWQVCEYNERLQQSEVLKYLTQEEVENKTTSGKVGFAVNYNGKPAAEVEAILSHRTQRRIYHHLHPIGYAVGKTLVIIFL